MRFTNVSLFSGAMGLDLGLEKAGFKTILAIEIDRSACETIRANRPRINVLRADIRMLSAGDILRAAGVSPGEIDLVSGGPDCQAFSTIGKRRSLEDPRGLLVKDFLRLVKGIRPKFFLMENVRGILSAPISRKGRKRSQSAPGSLFASLLKEIGRLGYKYSWSLLDAADYGVPQFRKRVFIVGNRCGVSFCFPKPTHSALGERRWMTLRDALRGLDTSSMKHASYSRRAKRYFRLIPPGGDWRSLPPRLQKSAMGQALYAEGGRTTFFRRLSFDRPCPTLLCDPRRKACSFCHPKEIRPLGVSEYARVQQFPDDWEIYGGTPKQYELVANAVPIGLSRALGRAIYNALIDQPVVPTNPQNVAKRTEEHAYPY
jgi:DNA (cytosine-5)-methyltransferase 1